MTYNFCLHNIMMFKISSNNLSLILLGEISEVVMFHNSYIALVASQVYLINV